MTTDNHVKELVDLIKTTHDAVKSFIVLYKKQYGSDTSYLRYLTNKYPEYWV